MQNHASMYPVEKMAKVLGVSRAGYYQYINRKESSIVCKNRDLLVKIKKINRESRHTYGNPRIHAILKQQGEDCSSRIAYSNRASLWTAYIGPSNFAP